jgi:hypothetical protein
MYRIAHDYRLWVSIAFPSYLFVNFLASLGGMGFGDQRVSFVILRRHSCCARAFTFIEFIDGWVMGLRLWSGFYKKATHGVQLRERARATLSGRTGRENENPLFKNSHPDTMESERHGPCDPM